VIAFVEDVAASGGYWLACGGPTIIVDANSIVGSIVDHQRGIRLSGSARAHRRGAARAHVGRSKSMLDPFAGAGRGFERLKRLQAEIHDGFKDLGCASGAPNGSRATRRHSSRRFWTGRRGVELGLADGLGELRATLQARYGAKVHLPVIAQRRRLLSRFGLGSAIDGMGVGPEHARRAGRAPALATFRTLGGPPR